MITGAGRAVSFERSAETSARLEEAGLQVARVPGSELGSERGGPRSLTCPVSREPVGLPDQGADPLAVPRAHPLGGTYGPGIPIDAGI